MTNAKAGLRGIKQTLKLMRKLVEQYKTYPQVRELALTIIQNIYQKNFNAEINSLFLFVKNHIRYVKDINGVETVQTPLKTLEYAAGDCDDKTTLLAALLESIGNETRFHAMGFKPGMVDHVLLEVKTPAGWLPLETTEPVNMGWIPPNIQHSIYA